LSTSTTANPAIISSTPLSGIGFYFASDTLWEQAFRGTSCRYLHYCIVCLRSVSGMSDCCMQTPQLSSKIENVKRHGSKIVQFVFRKKARKETRNYVSALCKINFSCQFRSDDWEINYDDLTIFFDEKLGSGAFSVVMKGKLNGFLVFALKTIQSAIAGLSLGQIRSRTQALEQGSTNCVAVKMAPNFAGESQKLVRPEIICCITIR